MRYGQDDRSGQRGNNQNFQTSYNSRDYFRSYCRGYKGGKGEYRRIDYEVNRNRSGHNRDNRAPTISASLFSETTNSNIIHIPTPSVNQVHQQQDLLLHPPVVASPLPINPANIELHPANDTLHNDMIQPVNNTLEPQQQAQNKQQMINQQQQLLNQSNKQFFNQTYRFPDTPKSWSNVTKQPTGMDLRSDYEAQRLSNEMLRQQNRAR
ncbi:MAG: hypothetical protein EZS28_025804 [Streblomastix strix]|uniref:Uncharacterized protein n=1 Tax=Streblomastix strix TaxID=222440 RepID=A0A5J4V784_9EUKA|nr:MAG: hypothetical protein EZS28_025804 [Streblomastix strix]